MHDEFNILFCSQYGDQVIGLEYESDVVKAQVSQRTLTQLIYPLSIDVNLTALDTREYSTASASDGNRCF